VGGPSNSVNHWNDVGPDPFTVRAPGSSVFTLVSLVDLVAPDDEHEGGDHGEVVGDQVSEA